MRGLKLVKSHGFRVVAGLGLLLGTLGLGSNLSLASTQLTSSTPSTTSTTLYASTNGSDTASCSSTSPCSLATALSTALKDFSTTPNVTIMLTTSGSTSATTNDYLGGFTVNTGTSSSDNITIENYDNDTPVLDGNNTSTVLTVNGSGTLSLIGLTITGGNGGNKDDDGKGGGINSTAPLTISNSTISDNSAGTGGNGGGIYSTALLNISNSTVSDNIAGINGIGGGIYSTALLTISNSTISDNSAGDGNIGGAGLGGGIYSSSTAPLTISNSTISGNSTGVGLNSVGFGGGIVSSSTLTISNSTISYNVIGYGGDGGGIYIGHGGTAKLTADLLADNTSSDGNCAGYGSFTDVGYNISSDGTCGFSNTSTSTTETNLVSSAADDLGSLASNGGPTETIAPQSSNPAIGFIPTTSGFCPATDQRGYVEPAGASSCDAGAFQTGYLAPQTISFTSTPPTNPVVGGTYTPKATSTSGLTVSFTTSSSSTVCAISPSTGVVSFTGAGTCMIDANQAGNTTYAPASTVSQQFTVAISSSQPARPQAVTIKTGPPVAPSDQSPLVPIGLGLTATGLLGVLGFGLKRRKTA